MPTTRFLPGDRVQVKPPSAAVLGLAANATHTIAHVDDFGQIAIRGGSSYYHPSHFKLVERASAEPSETYCLLDGEGDWWFLDQVPNAVPYWRLLNDPLVYRVGLDDGAEQIGSNYGIDAEPTQAVAGGDVHDPAPLQRGDWVQVWATIYDPRGDADEVEIRFYNLHDTRGVAYPRRDAIVRPAEGQTPPWVEERPEEPTNLGAVVHCEEGSVFVRVDAYGRKPWMRSGFDERLAAIRAALAGARRGER